ncbi:MAG: glycosyltransferase family 2 protein, partial [Verrucomicrobiota bacterium]
MRDPRVSILLPVRNGMATLARALDSLRGQTLPDWELVAVDDGSADGTGEFLQAAARRDPRIRVFSRPAQGLVPALNAGLAVARAPAVARMDADDEMLPTRLERQADWLERHPDVGLVSCRVEFGGDRASAAGYARHVDWLNAQLTPEEMALRRFVEAPVA